jgi:N-acetylmuramoyl-L-alanine amidase
MNKKAKIKFSLLIMLCIFLFPFMISNSSLAAKGELKTFKTAEELLEKRKRYFTPSSVVVPDRILKILIVPGHDDQYFGAVYKDVKEVELNRIVAQKLAEYLQREPGIEVTIAHEQNMYNPFLQFIFSMYKNDIENFIENSKYNFLKKIKKQKIELQDTGFHNTALPEVRHRLYGINWWANYMQADLVIHIHFNDYAGRKGSEKKYDGFSIYIPGEHFGNHALSKSAANFVFEELKKIRPVSNLPQEQKGIIEGHELIAIGSNESLHAGSMLIEYGYIYEDVFHNPIIKDAKFDYLAYSTYVGIKKFLGENYFAKPSQVLDIQKNKTTRDNVTWQFEKAFEGKYPPEGKTLRDCPITGFLGGCSQMVK